MTFELLNECWNSLTIKDQYIKLHEELASVKNRIIDLQNNCPHSDIHVVAKSDTGNYCRDDDAYWIEWSCLDCGAHGTIYSDNPKYKEFFKYV